MGYNSRGKGKISLKEIQRLLRLNGYKLDRQGKHFIYKKDNDTFILPRSTHDMVIRRMFKEHGIKTEEELKKDKKNGKD